MGGTILICGLLDRRLTAVAVVTAATGATEGAVVGATVTGADSEQM